jgi:RNA polymerase sigma-70 factor (ECF subfamily)
LQPRFEELLLPHLDAAYNLARFLTRDRTAADDIVQEAFLRAFRSFAGYRGGDAKAWLLAIVRNCSFNWTRANRADPAQSASDLPEVADDEQATPESVVTRTGEIEAVRAMIDRLPDPFRETLVLRELEDLSYKEVAEITGVPIGTVMSRLARGRRLLAEELERVP